MIGFSTALQKAVYERLQLVPLPVYDAPPNQPDGMPASAFPYITLGDTTEGPYDTDDSLGVSATLTLHVWSRYSGRQEAKGLMDQIYENLHRQASWLDAEGYAFIDSLYEFSQIVDEADGKTKHGIRRFRITMEQL